ncbi:MAG: Hpt domain-containing protein [Proteobacteria bacterium]|nr:Hpt domain-containing protein [Pseudomonadota bacterium]
MDLSIRPDPNLSAAHGGSGDDLSALSWVHDELRRSLETAHKALRRFVKEAEAAGASDIDAVDPAVLRTARNQLHQGAGALELVGLPAAATLLRASENAVQRYIAKPHKLTAKVVGDIEYASFALLDFIGRRLAGKPVSELALFPQYRAVQESAGADRVHPADLWPVDWRWRELPADAHAQPRQVDAASHAALESQLLPLMRGTEPQAVAARIGELCAGLGAGAGSGDVATLWKLAAAMFEAQAQGLLGFDVYSKRVASRLLAQFRALERGEFEVSERLAQDLLFFCAQSASPGDGRRAPRLAAVRQTYGLVHHVPTDYAASSLGRFDPALILQARKRVAAAKEAWSAVAGGEMHRLAGLSEQFALVGDSLKRIFPHGEAFAGELQQAIALTQQSFAAPGAPLAMEVATSLLYIEAALEDGDFDAPELAGRVERLAQRLAGVRQGRSPEPLEGWMEDLYRRVSDRQTMGSVVQELRASLSEAEKLIDQFFRKPDDRNVLIPVPHQLSAMRGVLSVLGMDQASAALVRMRDDVDGLITTEVDPERVGQAGVFDRLAGNLGALGFLIDMLSVQPQMAKSLFVFDADAGTLSPLMGRAAPARPAEPAPPVIDLRLIEQAQMLAFTSVREDVPIEDVHRDLDRLSQDARAAAQTDLADTVQKAQEALERSAGAAELAAARGALSEALVDFVTTASDPVALAPEAPRTAAAPITLDFGAQDLHEDEEMREVFLEEAREVLDGARAASAELAQAPGELEVLTTLRRAFHTLKGSSRMVGLKDFGEAAWAGEQVYNTLLAGQQPAGPALIEFTGWALGYLGAWVEDIAAGRAGSHDAGTVKAAADLLNAPPPAVEEVAVAEQAVPPTDVLDAAPVEEEVAFELLTDAPSEAAPAAAPDASAPMLLPPDLPSAADLEFGVSQHPPLDLVTGPDLTFEFDLGPDEALDPAAATASAPASLPPHEVIRFDSSAQALLDPFDAGTAGSAATEPMPLPEIVPEPAAAERPSGFAVDLDLGEAQPAESILEGLAPSSDWGSVAPTREPVAEPVAASGGDLDIVLDLGAPAGEAAPAATEPAPATEDELVKIVGPLRISIPLFNIYLNEADELSRRLSIELAEWSLELERPIGETAVALAHSLAGSSATVGFAELSQLARSLEHAQARSLAIGHGTPDEAALFIDAAEEIRRLLHQFAAGFLKSPAPELLERLADHERSSALRLEAATQAAELPPETSQPGDLVPELPLISLSQIDETTVPELVMDTRAAGLGDGVSTSVPPPVVAEPPVAAAEAAAPPFEPPLEPAAAVEALEAAAFETAPGALPSTDPVLGDVPEPTPTAVPSVESALAELPSFEMPAAPLEAAVPLEAAPAESIADEPAAAERDAPPAPHFATLGLGELKPLGALPEEPALPAAPVDRGDAGPLGDAIDAVDSIDPELFPIFEEEAADLLPQLAGQLRDWSRQPDAAAPPAACMRTLHTLKGGARLAGAMRLGEMAHRLETRIERVLAHPPVDAAAVDALQGDGDLLTHAFERLRAGDAAPQSAVAAPADEAPQSTQAAALPPLEVLLDEAPSAFLDAQPTQPAPLTPEVAEATAPATAPATEPAAPAPVDEVAPAPSAEPAADTALALPAPAVPPAELPPIDWSRFAPAGGAPRALPERVAPASPTAVRVRAPLLDRLVNQAGEVSIARSRIEASVGQIRGSLGELTENLERLRSQLRDIELQAETQMSTRMEAAKAASEQFDPLEFDRYTRFQELTRMMAESVNDVATLQRSLQRSVEATEDDLAAQARLARDLQDDLLRTRMIEFEGLSDRLYRVVRQAAKETGKTVRLDIVGGGVEVDRGVLDRMTASFEHLLRNCVVHGIEAPEARQAAGKDPTGAIIVALTHEGNEVGVEFRDDGAGLDLARIRAKGVALGMIDAQAEQSDAELANLIFAPGFTTSEAVTELAGRGVGMDVVRSEVNAMGGRIETATAAGEGTSFKMILPLTTAVTQVVLMRCGDITLAVPSTLVEIVRRATPGEVEAAYASGSYTLGERSVPFFWLGALLQTSARAAPSTARMRSVVVVRSAQQRIAMHVDEVIGNQEVVVKNLGPQLARLPGLAGVTLLASGAVALIYNPVALAALYGDAARAATTAALHDAATPALPLLPLPAEAAQPPLVLVVDDSLTVRRVTQRLLTREGYRVTVAKDGLDALERLTEEMPAVVLSDIEMPRMDGFDLVRNMRADARLRALPVIMITSRIAQKHRDYAAELGVDHYLGKPYAEEELLALVAGYTAAQPLVANAA